MPCLRVGSMHLQPDVFNDRVHGLGFWVDELYADAMRCPLVFFLNHDMRDSGKHAMVASSGKIEINIQIVSDRHIKVGGKLETTSTYVYYIYFVFLWMDMVLDDGLKIRLNAPCTAVAGAPVGVWTPQYQSVAGLMGGLQHLRFVRAVAFLIVEFHEHIHTLDGEVCRGITHTHAIAFHVKHRNEVALAHYEQNKALSLAEV